MDAIAPQVQDKFMERVCSRNQAQKLLHSRLLRMTRARRMAAEAIGTAFLLAAVVGSGIMGDRLSGWKRDNRTYGEYGRERCGSGYPDSHIWADLGSTL